MATTRLHILCGLPGSGKTTYAKQLEERSAAIRFCPDEWMQALALDLYDEATRDTVERLQWTLVQQLLARGVSVIIEWGTWGRRERDRLRVGARALGAAVELHYLTAPEEILFERIRLRGMETPAITREALRGWIAFFEVPDEEEFALFDTAYRIEP